ncbi:hypothetical protein FTV88_1728 [Heliorestis convoluta]|uniref:Uncharacterized protein n=1 Tax=Heliorestis convoluta TaxID=356322 RepID=A0A5Q2N2K7_9FIRM|nr:hypothetical protein FTV88_1728 [Heliorestis convoluta]
MIDKKLFISFFQFSEDKEDTPRYDLTIFPSFVAFVEPFLSYSFFPFFQAL